MDISCNGKYACKIRPGYKIAGHPSILRLAAGPDGKPVTARIGPGHEATIVFCDRKTADGFAADVIHKNPHAFLPDTRRWNQKPRIVKAGYDELRRTRLVCAVTAAET